MQKLLKILLSCVVPAMVLGQVISIEVRNFKYEVSASEFLILCTAALFVIYRVIKKDLNFYVPVIVLFFGLYLFLTGFSMFWASDISRTIIALRIGLYHIMALILVLNLLTRREDLKYIFYSFALAAVVISAQLIYQVYQLGGFLTNFIPERTSIVTPVGPWVTVSAIIVLILPFLYTLGLLYSSHSKKLSFFFFVGSAFAALASMLTLGKIEFVALLAGMVFFHYYYFSKLRIHYFSYHKKNLVKAALILLLIGISASSILAPFAKGFTGRFQNTLSDENTKFRMREYQLTFLAVKENIFTGVGAGNLKVYFRNNGLCQCYTEASNYFTHFFGELGVIGLLLFLASGRNVRKQIRWLPNLSFEDTLIVLCFKTSLVIFLVNGFFEATIVGLNYGIAFWMMVGAFFAFGKMIRMKTQGLEGSLNVSNGI